MEAERQRLLSVMFARFVKRCREEDLPVALVGIADPLRFWHFQLRNVTK